MKNKIIALFGLFLVPTILFNSCGQQPKSTITLGLTLPNGGNSTNKSLSKNSLRSDSVTYLPIQIYLKVSDGTSTVYDDVVDVYSNGTYTSSPSITLSGVSSSTSSITITGHYIAKKVAAGGSICESNGTVGNAFSNNTIYYTDFNETYSISSGSDQTISLTPTLSAATFDKFGLKIYSADGSAASANYTTSNETYDNSTGILTSTQFTPTGGVAPLITAVTLVDASSGKEIVNPCTGIPYVARTDTAGRVTTDLPLKFSDSTYLKLKVSQYSLSSTSAATYTETELNTARLSASTVQTYDIVSNASAVSACSGTPTNAPSVTVNNADNIPVFWNLSLTSSTPTTLSTTSAADTYLVAGTEALDGSTTICERIVNNYNPRFADVTSSNQAYLTPVDPVGGADLVADLGIADYLDGVNDLQLLTTNALNSFNNANDEITDQYDNSLTKNQDIAVKCLVGYYDLSLNWYNILGSIDDYITVLVEQYLAPSSQILTSSMYADCTTLATKYGLTDGLDQYFTTSGNESIYSSFYYTDDEGYTIYNNDSSGILGLTNNGSGQATVTNPINLDYIPL